MAAACTSGSDGPAEGSSRHDAGETLTIGYMLPQTGDLAEEGLGKPQIAAVRYAVKVINAAGGVNGTKLPSPPGADETGEVSTAKANLSKLLDGGVDAVIGPATSATTLAVIDTVVRKRVVECSGSNTASALSEYHDHGFYFRTSPSDALQGPVLGDLVVQTGHHKAVVLAPADDQDGGLQKATVAAIKKAGGHVLDSLIYDPQTMDVDALVGKVDSDKPDAVVLSSPDGAAQILQGLIAAGLGPDKIGIFAAGGERGEQSPMQVEPGNPHALDGMMGTAPAPAANHDFLTDLKAFDGSLATEQYAPQAFDCVITIALAAEQAHSSDPAKIKQHMVDVTRGGTTCTLFAQCKKLIDEGSDINYDGVSGPLDFDARGELASASIEIWQFENGRRSAVRTVTGTK